IEIVFPRIARYLYDVYLESKDSKNCALMLEKEFHAMFDLNDEHDCNVASVNSLNIFDASDMPSHKLGDAMFDDYDIFSPPSFDEQNYYDYSMPPIYDDYNDESGFGRVSTLVSDPTILEGVASYYNIDERGFGEVMTLFSDTSI